VDDDEDMGVEASVRKQTDGLQMYIPSPSVADFIAVIGSDLLPSMMYKLSR
jgi:hypothetical protein